MFNYIENMLQEFPIKFKTEGKNTFPAGPTMFDNDRSPKFSEQ